MLYIHQEYLVVETLLSWLCFFETQWGTLILELHENIHFTLRFLYKVQIILRIDRIKRKNKIEGASILKLAMVKRITDNKNLP